MKKKSIMFLIVISLLAVGTAFAQMGGGHMGGGYGSMSWGMGYGMAGAGGMVSEMMGNTMSHGFLDILAPLKTADDARAAIQAFIDSSNSSLQISELWEYGAAYKAELSDINGAKAFDLIADKLTGTVMPEMGFPMMMNASYGRSLYKMPTFSRNLSITPGQATDLAQNFVGQNSLGYTLEDPETYPGYYKFHTTNSGGNWGIDIMVSGYNGNIWMNTLLGVPVAKY